MHYEDPV